MPATAMRILIVGPQSHATKAAIYLFSLHGSGSQGVDTLAAARILLKTIRVDVVLASEHLPDGCGFELTDVVAEHSGNLLVSVVLYENDLWLPVVERGMRVLGTRAIRGGSLEAEIQILLSDSARDHAIVVAPVARQAASKKVIPPRRKASRAPLFFISDVVSPSGGTGLSGGKQAGRAPAVN